MSEPVLAVDFGTSNSLVGAWVDGKRVEALPLDPGAGDPSLMRTLLYFPSEDICYYGKEAIQEYINNQMEGRLFRSFKSHLANQQYLGTVIGNRILTLESTVGIFLLELKKRAEKILGRPVTKAVFGKPARYSMDPVRESFALHRMKKAIEFAGFKEFEFVPEPLAAAFDYRRTIQSEKIILIGDFGGGTSDFTLMKVGPYAFLPEHVLGIDGCPLAGDALDSLFMSHDLSQHFGAKSQYKRPMGSNVMTMPKSVIERLHQPAHIVHLKEKETYEFIKEVRKCTLRERDREDIDRLFVLIEDDLIFSFFEEIEKTKRTLSDQSEAVFKFDYPEVEIQTDFQRDQFNAWATETHQKIFSALDRCLDQAGVKPKQVDLVCLTGGTAQVPLFKRELERRFGKDKMQTQSHFHSVLSGLIESIPLAQAGLLPTLLRG
ncbi:MAG: Hsp70 family protein [Pseudobdellovibrionaceae bacterium]